MMDLVRTGRTFLRFYNYFNKEVGSLLYPRQSNDICVRNYAKRKGYREMAKKKKVKKVIEKQAWVPHNLRVKDVETKSLFEPSFEHLKKTPQDDVYIARYYTWRVFNLKEAIECHRETHHPTIYNIPNAQINLFIELDMSTARPTRFVDKFRRMAMLPHHFEQENIQERSILVFCKTQQQKEAAQDAGANLVGGVEIIKEIEKGKIVLPDFRFVIAHPTILPEMVSIRGLLKRKFPTVKSGTLGPNIDELVRQFKNGVEYSCVKDEKLPSFGWINTTIGRLDMDFPKLEENFVALLKDINEQRPNRTGPFIIRIAMTCPPSVEKFKINLEPYNREETTGDGESSDEDEAVPAKV